MHKYRMEKFLSSAIENNLDTARKCALTRNVFGIDDYITEKGSHLLQISSVSNGMKNETNANLMFKIEQFGNDIMFLCSSNEIVQVNSGNREVLNQFCKFINSAINNCGFYKIDDGFLMYGLKTNLEVDMGFDNVKNIFENCLWAGSFHSFDLESL